MTFEIYTLYFLGVFFLLECKRFVYKKNYAIKLIKNSLSLLFKKNMTLQIFL